MKKIVYLILLILLTFKATAQDLPNLKVAILPIENRTDSDVYSIFCEETARILEFNLLLLNSYQIINVDNEITQKNDFNLQDYMTQYTIDRSLVAHLEQKDSRLYFALSLFKRDQSEAVFTKSAEVKRFIDIFNITDTLIVEMLEFLTGRHIAYGNINLNNTGEQGEISIELDGIPVTMKDGDIPPILVGSYNLDIVQSRFGQRRILLSSPVTIKEDEFLDIDYSIPYLTESEEVMIQVLRDKIRERINGTISYEDSVKVAEELTGLFNEIEFCPSLKKERIPNRKLLAELQLVNLPEIWRQEFSSRTPLTAEKLLDLQQEMKELEIDKVFTPQLNTLFENYANLKTMEAAGQLWMTEAQKSLDIYDDLMVYNIHYSEEFREGLIQEYGLVRRVSNELGVLRLKRRNLALPIIFYSLAAVTLGTGITVDATQITQNNDTAMANIINQYYAMPPAFTQEERDFLASLHRSYDNLSEETSILKGVKWGSYISGAAFGAAGVATTFLVKKKLDRKQDKAFKHIYGNRWITAGKWALNKRFSFTEKDYNKLCPLEDEISF